ncbi:hypothetical protein [Streptomyces sp. NPDC056160]|uniref:hypothetical protein n=1 Tax=Streptomyces sp. NPDC056160 TaxID=3345731 RepID=UPI0035D73D8D
MSGTPSSLLSEPAVATVGPEPESAAAGTSSVPWPGHGMSSERPQRDPDVLDGGGQGAGREPGTAGAVA